MGSSAARAGRYVFETEQISEDVLKVRRSASGERLMRDEFDPISTFAVARVGVTVVGAIRITPSVQGPLNEWYPDGCPIPGGKDCVDLSRGAVIEEERRQGLFAMLMVYCLQTVVDSGFDRARGNLAPDAPHYECLRRLGFTPVGGLVPYNDKQLKLDKGIPIVCYLQKSKSLWQRVIQTNFEERCHHF